MKKGYTNFRKALRLLPPDIREKVIANMLRQRFDAYEFIMACEIMSPEQVMVFGFTWGESSEGLVFWQREYRKFRKWANTRRWFR